MLPFPPPLPPARALARLAIVARERLRARTLASKHIYCEGVRVRGVGTGFGVEKRGGAHRKPHAAWIANLAPFLNQLMTP